MDDDSDDEWTLAVERCRLKTIDDLKNTFRFVDWELIDLGKTSDELFDMIPCAIDEDRSKRIYRIARVLKQVIRMRLRSGEVGKHFCPM